MYFVCGFNPVTWYEFAVTVLVVHTELLDTLYRTWYFSAPATTLQLSVAEVEVILVAFNPDGTVHDGAVILMFAPLSLPITEGLEPTTLILYAVPLKVFAGMIALIEPDVMDVTDPIVTGDEKLPAASESCAVKMFPALKIPVAE